tara:strand:+ start:6426 stop:7214 length:789 start_codon:yes stop_codon:yes gene_type:complete
MNSINNFSPNIDELNANGYSIIDGLLTQSALDRFELTMQELTSELIKRRQIKALSDDPMIDLLNVGGEYREILFLQLKYLQVVQSISAEIGDKLHQAHFYDEMAMRVPLVWPTLRADPPNEETYLLPMHQDYGSIRSHRAFRMWIPLRDVSEEYGSMKVVVGSHKLGIAHHDLSNPYHPVVDESVYEGLSIHTLDLPAGSGVIFNPLTLHASIPNRSNRMKYILLIQIQDHSAMVDPDDADDEMAALIRTAQTREAARKNVR